MEVSRPATEEISITELTNIAETIAQSYGVEDSEVAIDATYITTGSFEVATPPSEEELLILVDAMAEQLGVEPEQITLTYEEDNGEIDYTITTTDYENVSHILESLQDPTTTETLNNN